MQASMTWKNDMVFEVDNRGHKLTIAAPSESGEKGPTPKELLLDAMIGCTGMDTISLLKKMRQSVDSFKIDVEAQKNTDHPVHFTHAEISFHIAGQAQREKVIKCVDKSLQRYCGVSYMVSKTCEIKYTVYLNDEEIHQGQAKFEDPKN